MTPFTIQCCYSAQWRRWCFKLGRVPVEVPEVAALRLGKGGRSIDDVASAACDSRDAFHLLFIHADRGGRAQERGLAARGREYCRRAHEICAFPLRRCVVIAPRHETEAWVLADPEAVMEALGYRGRPEDIGLPGDAQVAERLVDPKRTLNDAIAQVRGRRRAEPAGAFFTAIAQRQSLDALRRSPSYTEFETSLREALIDLGAPRRLSNVRPAIRGRRRRLRPEGRRRLHQAQRAQPAAAGRARPALAAAGYMNAIALRWMIVCSAKIATRSTSGDRSRPPMAGRTRRIGR